MCLQNRSRVLATLKHYDSRYNVAVVDIICFRSPRAIELEKDIPFAPNTDVVAVGFCFKGCKLMATKGVLLTNQANWIAKSLGPPRVKSPRYFALRVQTNYFMRNEYKSTISESA